MVFLPLLEFIRNWTLTQRPVGDIASNGSYRSTTIWMLLILNRRPKKRNILFVRILMLLHLNQILTTTTTLHNQQNPTSTYNPVLIHPSSNQAAVEEVFPKLCPYCLKPTLILNWSAKRLCEIKRSKNIIKPTKRRPFYLAHLTKPRRKRLLRNFPKPLHFQKGEAGQELKMFWKNLKFRSAP